MAFEEELLSTLMLKASSSQTLVHLTTPTRHKLLNKEDRCYEHWPRGKVTIINIHGITLKWPYARGNEKEEGSKMRQQYSSMVLDSTEVLTHCLQLNL